MFKHIVKLCINTRHDIDIHNIMGYTTLPLEAVVLDRLVGLLGVGDKVDNGAVDDVGRFDTRTDCTFPMNRITNILNV